MSCLRIALLVAAVAAASTYAEEDGLEWHVYASVLDANDTDAPELETDAPSWNETDAPAGTPDVPTATVPVAPETDAPSWNETDAPAGTPDVPTATVPVVPETDAPDANSTVVLPCRNDKECRQGGDDTAACTTAGCVCAAGFSQPRFHLEDAVIDRCYPDNTDTANATLETFFTLRFDAGKYDSLTEELRTKFKSILTTAFKRAPDTVLFLKGSIVVAGRVFVPLVSVIALEDAAATVKTELENEGSALLAVFGTNFVTDIVTSNNCITPGVHTALLVEGKCIVTDCMNGFVLDPPTRPTNSSVCVVLPPTPPPSNDDGLGGGAVAGIIIGASVFVAVAAAVALFCVRKHRSASPVMEGEAAEELRVPAQHYANPLPPPGQPLPLPNQ